MDSGHLVSEAVRDRSGNNEAASCWHRSVTSCDVTDQCHTKQYRAVCFRSGLRSVRPHHQQRKGCMTWLNWKMSGFCWTVGRRGQCFWFCVGFHPEKKQKILPRICLVSVL